MSNKDQNEYPLPTGDNKNSRQSTDLLPRYFRTEANKKILSSTLDQMVQPGVAEKISGFYGRKTAKAFRAGDTYIEDVSEQRQNRQLEPATVVKDDLGNVEFYKDYPDFVNQIAAFNGDTSNHSNLNAQEYYAWNPNINWDMLTNFREYYWLPGGPPAVRVAGQSREVISTYKVTVDDQDNNTVYKFSNRLAANPILTLYRGQTYRFEIDSPNFPIAFAVNSNYTTPNPDYTIDDGQGNQVVVPGQSENISSEYIKGQTFFDADGNEIDPQYIEDGVIEFTVPLEAPDYLFYLSENNINTGGFVKIYNIEANTTINVDEEVLGKITYTSSNGVEFTNGLKVSFIGDVTPAIYGEGEWYVEGVGTETGIKLISESELIIPAAYADDVLVPFGSGAFDRLPYGNASSFAGTKDYIVSNRASPDRNAWARYNRWFHADVIEASARYNDFPVELDQSARATRPIIEFEAGLKLFNYGVAAKKDVDLIDTFTTDAFSTIEGSLGYNVDNVQLSEGMRVLFAADTDRLVAGKIYRVTFIKVNNNRQISLIETDDCVPVENEVVLVTNGASNSGKLYWYTGSIWTKTQEKTDTNQPPLFDLYDSEGNSFSDDAFYEESTFAGNPVFAYREGTSGPIDSELGFQLSYRTIENVGDIQFDFALVNGEFTYQIDDDIISKSTDVGYLRKHTAIDSFVVQNGWAKAFEKSSQSVIRQYVVEDPTSEFEIDVYNRSSEVDDLKVKVYLDNVLQEVGVDYTVDRAQRNARIVFAEELAEDSNVILKVRSNSPKNENGYYEIAHNLERNPLNNKIGGFTLGEVNDHVDSIVENVKGFDGAFPGSSNLRDLGELDQYGKRFVQHSGPLNLAMYHITDKSSNVIKALRFNRAEYAKFKRNFLQTAENLGFDGTPKQQVDLILSRINSTKSDNMPFYFSDMAGVTASRKLEYVVPATNNNFYALSEPFTLGQLSAKSVLVYLNFEQLVHGRDYVFNEQGFVDILIDIDKGDLIEVFECDSTDGSFIPATPTKLGLYPAFVPQIFVDNTYRTPRKVVQGHDGSIVFAFDDYRDNIMLELEMRIYNNLKQRYNTDLFDLHNYVPGDFRNTGFSQNAIDKAMIADFVEWTTLAGDPDYTSNDVYEQADSFTYNYTGSQSPSGTALKGYWRSVYMQAYDTTRPHTHPWEMLGFAVEPAWWQSVYGPAPYTSNNLILWKDLSLGLVREPGQPERRFAQYARPTLLKHIPVDASGNLLSPLDSGYARNFVDRLFRQSFVFGDHTPAESAWRRSSEFPFSLITSRVLNQPNTTFATGFDLSRIQRNQVGQLIYTETGKVIRLKDIVFPNAKEDAERKMTSGLVNFVFDYLASDVLLSYRSYISQISRVTNQLSMKVGGFTEKEKFNLILDSRTPLNNGNVFLPRENYQIFLNTSSPVDVVTYSGVIVERSSTGYVIKGYDRENPVFKYFEPLAESSDPVINIGGVSEPFLVWGENKQYIKGQNVRFENRFYRVTESHVSSTTFDSARFRQLDRLPVEGGRDAALRRNFLTRTSELSYGTIIPTIQGVVDFLLGYESYLESQGFIFDFFNTESVQVENWTFSAKEFLFWTTQNWSNGSIITLSPGAEQIRYARDFLVVDDVFDNFYGYSLLQANGDRLDRRFSSIARNNQNEFGLRAKNTEEGIYHIRLPLVQKEHVILLDNTSVFNDVIYDTEAGYRQERVKVTGYRSDNWAGGLDIPGFIYDSAEVVEWSPWADFAVGDLVKYKEFFYVALFDVPGSDVFIAGNWQRLDSRPESKLIPNFDYRVNQFADFYDLDTDNFDVEQQKHAQHLIGYQKRQYLQNIINDDVSQYKFYQGFIQDKGTINALTKLFDALSSANKDSLEFYEEWAVRLGRYGDTDNSEVVEFILDEAQFRLDPQPVSLVNSLPTNSTDLVYRLRPTDIYAAPEGYNSKPFPAAVENPFELRSAGYVQEDDVSFRISDVANILTGTVSNVGFGEYVWIVGLNGDWDVVQHVRVSTRILTIESVNEVTDSRTGDVLPGALVTFDRQSRDLHEGDYIGVHGLLEANNRFYKINELKTTSATLIASADASVEDEENVNGHVSTFRSVRVKNATEINSIIRKGLIPGQRFWVDGETFKDWSVIENQEVFSETQSIDNRETDSPSKQFARTIAVTDDNTNLLIGDAAQGQGTVYSYSRANEINEWLFNSAIDLPSVLDNSIGSLHQFGKSVAVSADGEWLAIGSPNASNIASPIVGEFSPAEEYDKGDVVKYSEQYWSADREITSRVAKTQFTTFESYAFLEKETDSSIIKLFLQGAPYIPNTEVRQEKEFDLTAEAKDKGHVLVRAPIDQYLGSIEREQVIVPGNSQPVTVKVDKIYFDWNKFTNLNRPPNDNSTSAPLTSFEPFEDAFTNFINHPSGVSTVVEAVDSDFLSKGHDIIKKIDNVIFIEQGENFPVVGDTVTTDTSRSIVYRRYDDNFTITLYLVEVNGVVEPTGVLYNAGQLVGNYTQPTFSENPALGGYWLIETEPYINSPENSPPIAFGATGYGLVYQDYMQFRYDDQAGKPLSTSTDVARNGEPESTFEPFLYENILDTVAEHGVTKDRSLIINLSYRGDVQGELDDYFDSRWLIRLPKPKVANSDIQNDIIAQGEFNLWVNDSLISDDIENYGFDYDYLNGTDPDNPPVHTITEVWDGYIDFEFNATQTIDIDGDNTVNDYFEPVMPGEQYNITGNNTVVVFDSFTGTEAEVLFYQKHNIKHGRVYVNVRPNTGTGVFNPSNLLRMHTVESGNPNIRTIGKIRYVSIADEKLGKLAVIDSGTVPTISDYPNIAGTYNASSFNDFALVNGEYWFYGIDSVQGAEQPARYPSTGSRDWTQVFNIPVSLDATKRNGSIDQGAYSIYRRLGNSWAWVNTYIIPNVNPALNNNTNVAKDLDFAHQGDLYRLYISTNDRVYLVKNGTDQDGNEFDWALDLDPQYRGEWTDIEDDIIFRTGDIVKHNSVLYRAKTVIASSTAPDSSPDNWEELDGKITVESYVPHVLTDGLVVNNDSTASYYDDSTFSDQGLIEFATQTSVSRNGQIMAITVTTQSGPFDPEDPLVDNRVLLYRIQDGRYVLDQIIDAPTVGTGFGDSITLAPNGEFLAIGEPFSDTDALDQGTVYVYRQKDGAYQLTQTLSSPRNDTVEKFGINVSATDTTIAVASFNGDIDLPTQFDINEDTETTFDNEFTQFVNTLQDTGSVVVYEQLGETFVYADALEYVDAENAEFGSTLVNNRNHVYVGLPRLETVNTIGSLSDYRRAQGQTAWNRVREPLPVVDTNKIKEVFLYDRRTNQLVAYLDYLDVRQGKIAGPAMEQIDFKMFTDPARYNTTADVRYLDQVNNWEEQQVGKIWWDLSTARFANPYQSDAIYQSANWNRLLPGTSIDVYEWVESKVLPSEWDEIADSTEGIARGISGQSLYGDRVYSQKLKYDSVAGNFSNVYYFWVSNKFTIPNLERRTLSAGNIARLIRDPDQEGYRFVSFTSDNRFVLFNSDSLISSNDIVLAVSYYTVENQEQNVHSEYQLLSEGLGTSLPKPDIERKWFDSLVGYDERGRQVPDPDLSPRQRYGTLFRPRQSWFVNRQEALKQVVERANLALLTQPVVDSRDLSKLLAEDLVPEVTSGAYDYAVDSIEELRFIGTSKASQAAIEADVVNGEVTNVTITSSGRRYKDPAYDPTGSTRRRGPTVTVTGTGEGLEIDLFINNLGQVVDYDIVDPGQGYTDDLRVTVRPVSALVRSDSTIGGRWAIYVWNSRLSEWNRTITQDFDVKAFWDYADWYATGYNQFTLVNHLVQGSYQLAGLDDEIGDVTRIENIGQGGWLLLRKVADEDTADATVNYETIGRQNGTVQFKRRLYNNSINSIGFGTSSYDSKFFDTEPSTETRLIMQALKEDLLIDDLAVEYNALFFASVRYVLSEQLNVDWVFKTSFVKAKHNVGELTQKVTFQNNNLPSYNDYVEEVKPYKTNVREYISALERLEDTNSVVTDFDLQPRYDEEAGKILPRQVRIIDDELVDAENKFETFPDKHWKDNFGFKIVEIQVANGGTRYQSAPKVTIVGGGGQGAIAQAFVGKGQVTKIRVTKMGSGYTSRPTVFIEAPSDVNGIPATATPILGDSLVRSQRVEVKFDRVSGKAVVLTLAEQETFEGTAINTKFDLKWPMDLRTNKVSITIDGEEALRSEFSYTNINDSKSTYTKQVGQIEFAVPPELGAAIVVNYHKDPAHLIAADRIEHLYAPTSGMLGNDLSQLMTGVDYGGVEVRSFDFDTATGWDNDEWFTTTWDTYDTTFEDIILRPDGSTTFLELDAPLEDGVVYNVYKGVEGELFKATRIDDPEYDITTELANPNAQMPSIVGDGEQTIIVLDDYDIDAKDGDVFIIRKTTSDGSFKPDPDSFDTSLSGGDLNYGNATGLDAEDIIVDGDLFVTPVNSGGPEELVPGQVLDTVDIKVFERLGDGQGEIFNQNYVSDGIQETYSLGIKPNSLDAAIIKVGTDILNESEYTVDYAANTVTLNTVPPVGEKITILTVGINGNNVLDIGTFEADGSTALISTNIEWRNDLDSFVLVNGSPTSETAATIVDNNGYVAIEFVVAPVDGEIVDYGVFVSADGIQNYSRVLRDTLIADGSTASYDLTQAPGTVEPVEFYMLVEVDGNIITPGYNKEFVVESTTITEYELDKFQIPDFTIDPAKVRVFVDKQELVRGDGFVVILSNSSVRVSPGSMSQGSVIEVYYTENTEYTVTGSTIEFINMPAEDKIINVYQFTNHDVLEMERISYNVVPRDYITPGTTEFSTYHKLRDGKILLRDPAANSQYVWVVVNGKLLSPTIDYTLSLDKQIVYLKDVPEIDDYVEVIQFAGPERTPRMAWSQFKDILNRTHYKRVDNAMSQQLAAPLQEFDIRIEVDDASSLPNPDKTTNKPGIIFIEGERIEYFVKNGNLLRQLRRGTLGTGVKAVYPKGTAVIDRGSSKNIPYKDETIVQSLENDGSSTTYTTQFNLSTFSLDFGQTYRDFFEVFVGGRRLHKNAIQSYQFDMVDANGDIVQAIAPDSPAGDVELEKEFDIVVDGTGNVELVLTEVPDPDDKILIVRRVGKTWSDPGVALKDADNSIANFLRGSISKLPE